MKKNIFKVFILFILFIFPFTVYSKEKVNVYLFGTDTCPRCADAKEYFGDLKETHEEYFNFIYLEVSKNQDNASLMTDVSDELSINVTGVPYIVIGKYSTVGFEDSKKEELKNKIEELYESNDYEDIVDKIIKDKKYDVTSTDSNSGMVTMVLILVVIVSLFVFFIKPSKKSK